MSTMNRITLYTGVHGSVNGWKVVIVLEELGLEYESKELNMIEKEHKSPDYLKINPNGQVPALVDHQNNDFVVWDSAACMTYLVEKYDLEHTLSTASLEEKIITQQWLHFHNCYQATLLSELFYFSFGTPERVPLALARYHGEAIRLYGVLETVLERKEWLVGGKMTIADVAFTTWMHVTPFLMSTYEGHFDFDTDYPHVTAWRKRMMERPKIKKIMHDFDEGLKVHAANIGR